MRLMKTIRFRPKPEFMDRFLNDYNEITEKALLKGTIDSYFTAVIEDEVVYVGIFNKKDYELRFYENHDLALSNGADDAKIVTGKDGIVTGDVPWEDGEKDRRRCSRPPGQPHSGCNYTSKYGDFVIFDNVVVMCEGKDIMESRMTCSNLLGLLNVAE